MDRRKSTHPYPHLLFSSPVQFLLLLIVLVLLSNNALAFSDDFNDKDMTDWTIVTGSATAQNGYFQYSAYTVVSHPIDSTDRHIEFDAWMGAVPGVASTQAGYFCWDGSGATCTKGLNIMALNTGAFQITGQGVTLSTVNLPSANTNIYHILIDILTSDTQLRFRAYNYTNNELVSDQTVTYTFTQVNNVLIRGYIKTPPDISTDYFIVDNVYTSQYQPAPTANQSSCVPKLNRPILINNAYCTYIDYPYYYSGTVSESGILNKYRSAFTRNMQVINLSDINTSTWSNITAVSMFLLNNYPTTNMVNMYLYSSNETPFNSSNSTLLRAQSLNYQYSLDEVPMAFFPTNITFKYLYLIIDESWGLDQAHIYYSYHYGSDIFPNGSVYQRDILGGWVDMDSFTIPYYTDFAFVLYGNYNESYYGGSQPPNPEITPGITPPGGGSGTGGGSGGGGTGGDTTNNNYNNYYNNTYNNNTYNNDTYNNNTYNTTNNNNTNITYNNNTYNTTNYYNGSNWSENYTVGNYGNQSNYSWGNISTYNTSNGSMSSWGNISIRYLINATNNATYLISNFSFLNLSSINLAFIPPIFNMIHWKLWVVIIFGWTLELVLLILERD